MAEGMTLKSGRLIVVVSAILFSGGVGYLFNTTQRSTSDPVPPEAAPSPQSQRAASDPARSVVATSRGAAPSSQELNTRPSESTSKAESYTAREQIVLNQPEQTFTTEDGERLPLRTYRPLLTPNDPSATQWWTTSSGLPAAWNIGAGARQTLVAVIDTGFGLQHEEFTNRWAINHGEQGATTQEAASSRNCSDRSLPLNQSCNLIDDDFDGVVDNEVGATNRQNPSTLNCSEQGKSLDKACNLIDDDDNGYIDDVHGWDFANYDASVQAGQTNPDGSGVEHGTEVTGILAATGNNSKGIAGVDWSTQVLPLQAIDDDSYGNTLTVARAIYYATDRGADIISISLGSSAPDTYLRRAIAYALDHGSLVVAASGNDGCDCISYPARYQEVIAVGAQQQNGTPASFSNFGAELDILAPGYNMRTSTWSKFNGSSAYANGVSGTSFATPYVSGLLSLSRSHHSTASWGELTHTLLATAAHGPLTVSAPFSPTLGSGYAHAGKFLTRLTTPSSPQIQYVFTPTPYVGALASQRAYQCILPSDFPTAPLLRIASATDIFYTIDPLEGVRATERGNTVRSLGRTCVGLPGDLASATRHINLLGEIENMQQRKSP